MTSAVKVYGESIPIDVDEIEFNNWNPNFCPTDIMNAIKDDILKNGFIGTIVLQKHNEDMDKDNVVINGEHRLRAYKELGGKEIPCTILDVDDDIAKALTVRLNREHGELLPNKIGELLRSLSPEEDLNRLRELTFMPEKDLKMLMDLHVEIKPPAKPKVIADRVKIDSDKNVICPKCTHRFEVYYG
jgi:hypothetical protein